MKKITIYTSPTCGHCTQLKEWLAEKEVKYQEINVIVDAEQRKYIVEKTGQMGVPVVVISDEDGSNEQIVLGFDQEQIAKLGNI
ncbi:MAG TPA: glutaredoxin domain-containing protein [bacterium]|nr:glutaredoxin domain-containing protein [bacterium]